jgi:hypothetical protein
MKESIWIMVQVFWKLAGFWGWAFVAIILIRLAEKRSNVSKKTLQTRRVMR